MATTTPLIEVTFANALNDLWETHIGTSPKLDGYTGSRPGPNNAATGTLLVAMTLPSDWAAASANYIKAKSGSWTANSSATGTLGYFRMKTSGGSAKVDFTVSAAIPIALTAQTNAGSNTLTVASTTGVVAGQGVYASGVPTGTTVFAVPNATTITMTEAATANIPNTTEVYFGDVSGEILVNTTTISAINQVVTVTKFNLVAPGRH